MRTAATLLLAGLMLPLAPARADDLPPNETQAEKVHRAFENARQAHKKKPLDVEKAMADEPIEGDWFGKPLSSLNPADRRASTQTPVLSAQDAVSRPSPQ